MGNCCTGQSSIPATAIDNRRVTTPKNNRVVKHDSKNGYISSSSSSSSTNRSNGGSLREVKIRMTKKELEELVGWLNMADSSFEHVMARLVNVISDRSGDGKEDDNNGEVVKLRQQTFMEAFFAKHSRD